MPLFRDRPKREYPVGENKPIAEIFPEYTIEKHIVVRHPRYVHLKHGPTRQFEWELTVDQAIELHEALSYALGGEVLLKHG